jgi:hydrogenase maturation factor
MCIARVGKIVSTRLGKGTVEFFDGRALDGVDLSAVGTKKGDFVEVFGGVALSVLTPAEARRRRKDWKEVRRAAGAPLL